MTPKEVRNAREILGLTQEQLAHVIKTTGRTVARWESGETSPMPVFVSAIRSLLKDKLAEGQAGDTESAEVLITRK